MEKPSIKNLDASSNHSRSRTRRLLFYCLRPQLPPQHPGGSTTLCLPSSRFGATAYPAPGLPPSCTKCKLSPKPPVPAPGNFSAHLLYARTASRPPNSNARLRALVGKRPRAGKLPPPASPRVPPFNNPYSFFFFFFFSAVVLNRPQSRTLSSEFELRRRDIL